MDLNENRTLISVSVAVAAALLSVSLVRLGVFGVLFLLPLALAGFFGGEKPLWLAAFLAVTANGALLLAAWGDTGVDSIILVWNILYYSVMVLAFCWINSDQGKRVPFFPIPMVYRVALGSLAASVAIIPCFLAVMENREFVRFVGMRLDAVYKASGGELDAEAFILSLVYLGIRGGILVSVLFFFAISRQFAVFITWLARRGKPVAGLISFKNGQFLIWVLSASLGAVLVGKTTGVTAVEAGAWNILALCAILYLAQGGGIALYFLVRLPPFYRLLVNLALLILLFRPGINMVLLGILILTGIIENWVPFRAFGSQGSPPTPEA
ncbi:MAG: hypothetical protein LBP69_02435 [Treponema sp.]|jgi:hypothetical protein|nr:hypothetical protein [Treponema sp.]